MDKFNLIAAAILLSCTVSLGQCPKKTLRWIEQIKAEYPGENLTNIGPDKVATIVYNLYSDEYFIPIFKKPFDALSERELKAIDKIGSLAGCARVIPGNRGELMSPVKSAIAQNNRPQKGSKFSYEVVKRQVKELREVRKYYQQFKLRITDKSATMEFDEIQKWKDNIQSRYSILILPSERASMSEFIKKHEAKFAIVAIENELKRLENLPDQYSSLESCLSFWQENENPYSALSDEMENRVDERVEGKINRILNRIVPGELPETPLESMNISQLNDFYNTFDSRYDMVTVYPAVDKMYERINSAKSNLISANMSAIERRINSSKTADELNSLSSLYLTGLYEPTSNAIYADLVRKIEARKNSIVKEEEQMRIAAYEEEKRREQRLANEKKVAEARAMERQGFKLNTAGIKDSKLILDFLKGNFQDIILPHDGILFSAMIYKFMHEQAEKCQSALPSDKVRIYKSTCSEYLVYKDSWGNETSRSCISWVEEPTDLFTTSELYSAVKLVSNSTGSNTLKIYWDMLTGQKPIQSIFSLGSEGRAIQADIVTLVASNTCDNKALKRFEANLIRYAHDRAPLKLTD